MALQSDSSSEHRFTCHSIKRCSNIMNNWFDVAVNLSTYISGFVWVSGRYCQGKFEKPTPIQAIRLRSLRSSVFWDTRNQTLKNLVILSQFWRPVRGRWSCSSQAAILQDVFEWYAQSGLLSFARCYNNVASTEKTLSTCVTDVGITFFEEEWRVRHCKET